MGIFYVLFIYVLQGYFGIWTKKSRCSLKSSVLILPLLWTTGLYPPDRVETGFPVLPLKRLFLFKSLYKAFFQAFLKTRKGKNVQKRRDQTQERFCYCYIIC